MVAVLLACFVVINATSSFAATASYPLSFPTGWNLAGNSLTTPIDVKTAFGTQANIQTVWKWDTATSKWSFYAPTLDTAGTLATYVVSKGYSLLTTINQGEGYWVNASAPVSLGTQSGSGFSLGASNLVAGWNLAATADNVGPGLLATNAGNVTTLWAWDNATSAWYFHAPSLATNNTQASYIQSKGYKEFGALTLDKGLGFWVNYAGATTGGGTSARICGDTTSINSFFSSNKGFINVSRTGGNTSSLLYQQFGNSSYRMQIAYVDSSGSKSVIVTPTEGGSSLATAPIGPEDVYEVLANEVNVLLNAAPAQPQVGYTGVLQCDRSTGVWKLAIASANSALNNVTLTSNGSGSTGTAIGAGLYTAVPAQANSGFLTLLNTACTSNFAQSNGTTYTNCSQGAATAAASLSYNMWLGGLPRQAGGDPVSGPGSVSPGTAKVSFSQGMAGATANDSCTVNIQEPYIPVVNVQTNGARYFASGVDFGFRGTETDTISITSGGVVFEYTMTNGQGGKIEVHPNNGLFGTGITGTEAKVWSDVVGAWTNYFTCK